MTQSRNVRGVEQEDRCNHGMSSGLSDGVTSRVHGLWDKEEQHPGCF